MRHSSVPPPARVSVDDVHLESDVESIRNDFVEKLFFMQAKFPEVATRDDHYKALSYVVRDRLLLRWVRSAQTYLERESRTVAYLSAEYLLGPQLGNAMLALGITDEAGEAMRLLGLDLEQLLDIEEEPGLGNGGLGRLAACFMDSLATLEIPAIGYGIRYEFGIFDQEIRDGWQIEKADRWLRFGNPWEIARPQIQHPVGLGGHTEHGTDARGRLRVRWHPARMVRGVPYDTPVLGYGTDNANFLRLWSAVSDEEFDLEAFNRSEYWKAVEDKVRSENITKILYPNDSSLAGRRLRLEQQYFFVACSLRDMMRILVQKKQDPRGFADKFRVQLNDTHPSIGVAELMRLLVDEHEIDWDEAWEVTRAAFAYTNHTLLPEALETWPLPLFGEVLPRHLEIIFEINQRFLQEVRERFPGDEARLARMSLIDEGGDKRVRMAHLATVGANRVNGVAALHSELLTQTVMRDFAEMWPDRFTNVTNGVTPRRFVALSNPPLRKLITDAIGEAWIRDLERLRDLEPFAEEQSFRERFRAAKQANKESLSRWLTATHALDADPSTLFDVQVKRIHEYKRQLLMLLRALWQIERMRAGYVEDAPRTLILGGKAAPGYWSAKLIIKLAHVVADLLARDAKLRPQLRLVFVPDFNVKVAQRIYPAADLSEQLSTAGYEASGTGNMKFALNGALTIGTLDGANVEIREHVGAENFFLFGLRADEVMAAKRGGYHPSQVLEADAELRHVLEGLADGRYCPREAGLFAPLVRGLVDEDPYLVLADFRAYVGAQEEVARAWGDREAWTRSAILNVARCGNFSSDRSIRDYVERVWHVEPVRVAVRK
jgi:glycogen phosphorylase